MSRTWKALIMGLELNAPVPSSVKFIEVVAAVNVPSTYCPTPPEVLVVLASSVTAEETSVLAIGVPIPNGPFPFPELFDQICS